MSHQTNVSEITQLLPTKSIKNGSIYPSIPIKIDIGPGSKSATLTWEHINVVANKPSKGCCSRKKKGETKQILFNVYGHAKPGNLLAIIGSSGGGKTTLLNVLNKRNLAGLSVEGCVKINGEVADAKAIARSSCYVQQNDIFIGTLTVREHLIFHAYLRMNDKVKSVKNYRVNEVIRELGLTKCENSRIGTPGKTQGISGGERKRLSFASEILTNPAILICDEPTSGLDSYRAENLIKTLKELTKKGKTILCTIHQPSSQVFSYFDQVLLLSEGRVLYFGSSIDMPQFFASLNHICPTNYNPADFYVHQFSVIPDEEIQSKEKILNTYESFNRSPYFCRMIEEIKDASKIDDEFSANVKANNGKESKFKVGLWRQFTIVLWRAWLAYVREPALVRSKVFQYLVSALLFGFIYLNQVYDQKGIMNINGALFLLQNQISFGSIYPVINTFPPEFMIFMKDHHDMLYGAGVYYICKMLAELPIFIFVPIMYSTISYWMIGLYNDFTTYVIATGVLLLDANVAVSFGYVLSCSTNNIYIILSVTPIILVIFMIFGGLFVNSSSIPVYFKWIQYLSWFSYSNELLVVNQWKNVKHIDCASNLLPNISNFTTTLNPFISNTSFPSLAPTNLFGDGPCFSNGHAVIASLGYTENNQVIDVLCMLALLVFFRVLSFLLLFIRSRKRN